MPESLTFGSSRTRLGASMALLSSGVGRAMLTGDLILAALLVCAAMLFASVALSSIARAGGETVPEQPLPPMDLTEAGEPTGEAAVAAPPSLAFLSDPFAIPPPVLADMQAVQPFVETLCGQIEGIQTDVAEGVVSVVRRVEAINMLSSGQRERIGNSLEGVVAMRRAVSLPGGILNRLDTMLAERDRLIADNFTGLRHLAEEFQDLRVAVDVISKVADKAFFLAVNASVEAHHQGSAGLAFGLIASEMRALASQTAEGARTVGQSINFFAERMQAQLTAAMPGTAGDGNSEVKSLIAELETAQHQANSAGLHLDGMVQTLDTGHTEIVLALSDILGHLQFQDVMQQRLGQVFDALRQLSELVSHSSSGSPRTKSLLDLLEDQQAAYVMSSQRAVHAGVGAGEPRFDEAAVRIQLF